MLGITNKILQQTIYGKYLGKKELKKVIKKNPLPENIEWLLLKLDAMLKIINDYLKDNNDVSDENTVLYTLEYIQNLIDCVVYEHFLSIDEQYKVSDLIDFAITEHVFTVHFPSLDRYTFDDICDFVHWIEENKPVLQQKLFTIKLLPEVKRIYIAVDKTKQRSTNKKRG